MSFCEIMAGILKDPLAPVPQLKVKELLALKAHVDSCANCKDIPDEVMKSNPGKQFFQSENN